MIHSYQRAMARLYQLCMVFVGFSIVGMVLIISWSVYTRYILELGSFWAEPIAIMLAVQTTFFGAAACYRAGAHISIDMATRQLPPGIAADLARWIVDLLVMTLAIAMVWYGMGLVRTTWFQVYPEFQEMRVGAVYLAVPASGLVTLLFAIERMVFGPAPADPPAPAESGV